jgi:hypothetical protein
MLTYGTGQGQVQHVLLELEVGWTMPTIATLDVADFQSFQYLVAVPT